jgi:hypothetical protein
VKRAGAAALSVALAAGTGVVTNLVTQRWTFGLGAGLVVLVLLGGAVQIYLASGDRGDASRSHVVSQRASARGGSTVVQGGRDAVVESQQPGEVDG